MAETTTTGKGPGFYLAMALAGYADARAGTSNVQTVLNTLAKRQEKRQDSAKATKDYEDKLKLKEASDIRAETRQTASNIRTEARQAEQARLDFLWKQAQGPSAATLEQREHEEKQARLDFLWKLGQPLSEADKEAINLRAGATSGSKARDQLTNLVASHGPPGTSILNHQLLALSGGDPDNVRTLDSLTPVETSDIFRKVAEVAVGYQDWQAAVEDIDGNKVNSGADIYDAEPSELTDQSARIDQLNAQGKAIMAAFGSDGETFMGPQFGYLATAQQNLAKAGQEVEWRAPGKAFENGTLPKDEEEAAKITAALITAGTKNLGTRSSWRNAVQTGMEGVRTLMALPGFRSGAIDPIHGILPKDSIAFQVIDDLPLNKAGAPDFQKLDPYKMAVVVNATRRLGLNADNITIAKDAAIAGATAEAGLNEAVSMLATPKLTEPQAVDDWTAPTVLDQARGFRIGEGAITKDNAGEISGRFLHEMERGVHASQDSFNKVGASNALVKMMEGIDPVAFATEIRQHEAFQEEESVKYSQAQSLAPAPLTSTQEEDLAEISREQLIPEGDYTEMTDATRNVLAEETDQLVTAATRQAVDFKAEADGVASQRLAQFFETTPEGGRPTESTIRAGLDARIALAADRPARDRIGGKVSSGFKGGLGALLEVVYGMDGGLYTEGDYGMVAKTEKNANFQSSRETLITKISAALAKSPEFQQYFPSTQVADVQATVDPKEPGGPLRSWVAQWVNDSSVISQDMMMGDKDALSMLPTILANELSELWEENPDIAQGIIAPPGEPVVQVHLDYAQDVHRGIAQSLNALSVGRGQYGDADTLIQSWTASDDPEGWRGEVPKVIATKSDAMMQAASQEPASLDTIIRYVYENVKTEYFYRFKAGGFDEFAKKAKQKGIAGDSFRRRLRFAYDKEVPNTNAQLRGGTDAVTGATVGHLGPSSLGLTVN